MRKSGPPRGLISYIVLELLEEKPRYGYEILKEITEISGGHWEPSYGSVYPILYKFEEEGYAERIDREDEPDRKYFAITDEGHEHLAEKRREVGGKARDFADVILGFYHMYVAFATDGRFDVDPDPDHWHFDDEYSGWIAEQVIRHHERDFGEFERIPDTPEAFHARQGDADAPDGSEEEEREGDDASEVGGEDGEGGDESTDHANDGGEPVEGTAADGGTEE